MEKTLSGSWPLSKLGSKTTMLLKSPFFELDKILKSLSEELANPTGCFLQAIAAPFSYW
uniref:Uncharacterized protein n=1 Tax=Arundo donax TaxID=35708 RepID=A0A0A9FXF7_ARUDO